MATSQSERWRVRSQWREARLSSFPLVMATVRPVLAANQDGPSPFLGNNVVVAEVQM